MHGDKLKDLSLGAECCVMAWMIPESKKGETANLELIEKPVHMKIPEDVRKDMLASFNMCSEGETRVGMPDSISFLSYSLCPVADLPSPSDEFVSLSYHVPGKSRVKAKAKAKATAADK
eukprot:9463139-Pyramimonas_sp.AAC.1